MLARPLAVPRRMCTMPSPAVVLAAGASVLVLAVLVVCPAAATMTSRAQVQHTIQLGNLCEASSGPLRDECDHVRAMANAINNKTDGFFDHLLPHTRIEVRSRRRGTLLGRRRRPGGRVRRACVADGQATGLFVHTVFVVASMQVASPPTDTHAPPCTCAPRPRPTRAHTFSLDGWLRRPPTSHPCTHVLLGRVAAPSTLCSCRSRPATSGAWSHRRVCPPVKER